MISKLGLRYKYSKYTFRPFIEAGVAYTKLLDSKAHFEDKYSGRNYEENLRDFFLGFYGAVGLDYKLKKENALFVCLSYDVATKENMRLENGSDQLKIFSMKLGYTF